VRLAHALQLSGILDGLGSNDGRHQVDHSLTAACSEVACSLYSSSTGT
jgi:hypothetical protein